MVLTEYLNSLKEYLSDLSISSENLGAHLHYFSEGEHCDKLNNLSLQLQCLSWMKTSPKFSIIDKNPNESIHDKRLLLLAAIKQAIQGNYEMNVLYDFKKEKITINNTEIAVEQLLLENYSFILYKQSDQEVYFLDVMFNQSAAYWNKLIRVQNDIALGFLKEPSYEKAKQIVKPT
jgi:hypothetical protein